MNNLYSDDDDLVTLVFVSRGMGSGEEVNASPRFCRALNVFYFCSFSKCLCCQTYTFRISEKNIFDLVVLSGLCRPLPQKKGRGSTRHFFLLIIYFKLKNCHGVSTPIGLSILNLTVKYSTN